MSHSRYTDVMTNLKLCLIGAGFTSVQAQELLNKHYMLIKPVLYTDTIVGLSKRILDIEFPPKVKKPLFTLSFSRKSDDSCSRGPSLWECDPFTGTDMYGNTYNGDF